MNLLFAINHRFINLFQSCICSILQNGGEDRYTAYILHSDLSDSQKQLLQRETGERVDCRFIDVDPAYFNGFPESERYPKQIYYRLASPLLLPADLDRILYLDVDTVVINPLRPFYETEFEGAYYVGCTHTNAFLSKLNQMRLGSEKETPYINSGVLLFNLSALRQNFSLEEIRSYANKKQYVLMLPDQDILTALYGDKVKLADTMRYNLSDRMLAFHNANPANEKIDLDWIRKNAVVIHYCGKNKPWTDHYMGTLGIFYQEIQNLEHN